MSHTYCFNESIGVPSATSIRSKVAHDQFLWPQAGFSVWEFASQLIAFRYARSNSQNGIPNLNGKMNARRNPYFPLGLVGPNGAEPCWFTLSQRTGAWAETIYGERRPPECQCIYRNHKDLVAVN